MLRLFPHLAEEVETPEFVEVFLTPCLGVELTTAPVEHLDPLVCGLTGAFHPVRQPKGGLGMELFREPCL